MKSLHTLEIHVAHGCNFSCESCSHFAGNGLQGLVGLEEAEAWMGAWTGRVQPKFFGLVGGEPALHPRLSEYVRLARRKWPAAGLFLTTNGILLHQHPLLPAALAETGTLLRVTMHHDSAEYRSRFAGVVELLRRWRSSARFRIEVVDGPRAWTRRYYGVGAGILPIEDGKPRQSWRNCVPKRCRQLFRGKLWKCATIAYLQLQKEAYPAMSPRWSPYLAYAPLDPRCSEAELDRFLAAEEESVCNMCPAVPVHFTKPSPLRKLREVPDRQGNRQGS